MGKRVLYKNIQSNMMNSVSKAWHLFGINETLIRSFVPSAYNFQVLIIFRTKD